MTPEKHPWTWKNTAWVLGTIFVLFILLPLLIAAAPFWDGPPVDDRKLIAGLEDLTPPSPEKNAYFEYAKAMSICDPPYPHQFEEWQADPEEYQKELAEFLATAPEAILHIREGLPHTLVNLSRQIEIYPYDSGLGIDFENETKNVHLIPGTLSRLAVSAGESETYLQIQLRITKQLKQDPLLLWEWFQSSVHFSENIRHHAYRFGAPPDLANNWPDICTLSHSSSEWFLWDHYETVSKYLQGPDTFKAYGGESYVRFLRSLPIMFQPNNTQQMFHDSTVELIGLVRRDELSSASESAYKALLPSENWQRLINHMGHILFYTHSLGTWFDIIDTRLRLERDSTRLIFALQAYHRDHEALPQSLGDLVPDYLEALPLDPYTGASYLYDREEKRIRSAGQKSNPGQGEWGGETLIFGIFEPLEPP